MKTKGFSDISLSVITLILTVVLIFFSAALAGKTFLSGMFSDYDTALYWSDQLFLAGREVMGIILVVYIFEFIITVLKIKE